MKVILNLLHFEKKFLSTYILTLISYTFTFDRNSRISRIAYMRKTRILKYVKKDRHLPILLLFKLIVFQKLWIMFLDGFMKGAYLTLPVKLKEISLNFPNKTSEFNIINLTDIQVTKEDTLSTFLHNGNKICLHFIGNGLSFV